MHVSKLVFISSCLDLRYVRVGFASRQGFSRCCSKMVEVGAEACSAPSVDCGDGIALTGGVFVAIGRENGIILLFGDSVRCMMFWAWHH